MMFWHKLTEHIFFSVHFQTFCFQIFLCLDFYRNNFLSIINKSILQLIHYGVFEFLEYVIAVKRYVLAYAYHTIQQAELSNRAIIIFFTSWKVKKNISYGYQLYQKCQSSVYGFSIVLKFIFFVSATILKLKRGVGISHQQTDFVNTMYWQNLSLRPPVEVKFLLPAILEIFRKFFISHQIQFVIL